MLGETRLYKWSFLEGGLEFSILVRPLKPYVD